MPPFIPQKRPLSSSPDPSAPSKKQNLFRAIDHTFASGTIQENKDFLNGLEGDSSDSSLSDVSDSSNENFEDIHPELALKRQKRDHSEDGEDGYDWENAVTSSEPHVPQSERSTHVGLELTLDKGHQKPTLIDLSGKKKGPSKVERQIRNSTHRMHVQFLLFHNWIRNSWTCDTELQRILLNQLPPNVRKEVERWRVSSGLQPKEEDVIAPSTKRGKKGKTHNAKGTRQNTRDRGHWGAGSTVREKGIADMSHGDPIIRLLKVLAAYWRKRFVVAAPSLRKQGYKSLLQLEEEISSFKKNGHDPDEHGERISGKDDLRSLAKSCEGSRDVGAQLFLALARSLGIDARLVASLQPVGFGWNKNEEAANLSKNGDRNSIVNSIDPKSDIEDSSLDEVKLKVPRKPRVKAKAKAKPGRGAKDEPIDLDDGDGFTYTDAESGDHGASTVDVTPQTPRKRPDKSYDKDLLFPTYWIEAISPITHQVYPVDPLVLTPAVATNADLLAAFEPRGAKADKAKQVMAYVIAYSFDGTAKDVTTRYMRRHVWPGRTKGVRMPVERIPIYNKRGKIKKYEDYDWFKTVISGYRRTEKMRTVVDDIEDAKDLKSVKIEKKEAEDGGQDTLQSLKSSADFVLERHLRREEAIIPGAAPVREFTSGKGEKAKSEPVFNRKDVVVCRTAESWHKEGRGVKEGEHPMKSVPVRAVTMNRKREVEEAQRDGEKLMQGMYAWDQTDWIIPPPIENGVIPKNAYGNMDCFVPSMVPVGAIHIPLRGTMKVCKRLGIDSAEAVTGFEFGNRMAVPVITGVIVATEHEELVMEEWEKDEEERKRKEDAKREKMALSCWKKFLVGLRIKERFRDEFGEDFGAHSKEEFNPFTNRNRKGKSNDAGTLIPSTPSMPEDKEGDGFRLEKDDKVAANGGEDMGGGFILEEGDFDNTPIRRGTLSSFGGESERSSPDEEIEQKNGRNATEKPKAAGTKRKRGRPSKQFLADSQQKPVLQQTHDTHKAGRRPSQRQAASMKSPYFASDSPSNDQSSLTSVDSSFHNDLSDSPVLVTRKGRKGAKKRGYG